MTKAEKGDLIRIVRCDEDEPYQVGDIYTVAELSYFGEDDNDVYITKEGGQHLVCDHEYQIYRKAGGELVSDYQPKSTEDDDGIYEMDEAYLESLNEVMSEQSDVVNHPDHYNQGRFETIEIIEEITKNYSDGYVAYCVGNSLKYLARAPFKHGEPTEDLAKAERYLAFANEYLTQNKSE